MSERRLQVVTDSRTPLDKAIDAAKEKAALERWKERAERATAILPKGWDVHVEPAPNGQGFLARDVFVVPGGPDAFSAIDAVVDYYKSLQRDPKSRILVP